MSEKEIIIDRVCINTCLVSEKCKEFKTCKIKNILKQLARKTAECEELKKTVLTKCPNCNSEYLTPKGIELYKENQNLKQECEELKKEIINKNKKIKELRFSVSDLTNRLCYLNAEKSFRIVDLEQTLDEIEKELKEDIYCENQECGCDDFEECLKCTKEHILDIINKAKDGE